MNNILQAVFLTSCILFSSLSYGHKQQATFADRIKGALFGAAVGDALGKLTEFIKSYDEICKKYPLNGIGSFADFKPEDFVNGVPVVTDDTIMSMVTLQVLIKARERHWDTNRIMSELAIAYVKSMDESHGWAAPYRAPGLTCVANVKKLKAKLEQGEPWKQDPRWWSVGTHEQGGCGSVMRAHPFGLVFADDPRFAAHLAAQHSTITHGAPMAKAACAAMAAGTACAVLGAESDVMVNAMIDAAKEYDKDTADLIKQANAEGKEVQQEAFDAGEMMSHVYGHIVKNSKPIYKKYLGWDAKTAIAAATYTVSATPSHNPHFAFLLGVNTPGDSDSIASMAGALVGAQHGFSKLQERMADDLARVEKADELRQLSDKTAIFFNT